MSLEKFLKENKLTKHQTSVQEIQKLFRLVDRDIQEVSKFKYLVQDWIREFKPEYIK